MRLSNGTGQSGSENGIIYEEPEERDEGTLLVQASRAMNPCDHRTAILDIVLAKPHRKQQIMKFHSCVNLLLRGYLGHMGAAQRAAG